MERHLYDYADVQRDFEDISRLLEEHPERLVQEAVQAGPKLSEVVAHLKLDLRHFSLERDARMVIEGFERDANIARLRFRWEALSAKAWFPVIHASLEIYALAHKPRPLTQLAFVGRYQPPLWFLGTAGDAAIGHRVAEAVVHHFVTEVKERIEGELRAGGGEGPRVRRQSPARLGSQ